MRESLGGEWGHKRQGPGKKIAKGFLLGKPYLFNGAGRTLGLWIKPSIFAWIIITTGNRAGYDNVKTDRKWKHLDNYHGLAEDLKVF
jgi:hypothetical protein